MPFESLMPTNEENLFFHFLFTIIFLLIRIIPWNFVWYVAMLLKSLLQKMKKIYQCHFDSCKRFLHMRLETCRLERVKPLPISTMCIDLFNDYLPRQLTTVSNSSLFRSMNLALLSACEVGAMLRLCSYTSFWPPLRTLDTLALLHGGKFHTIQLFL